MDKNSGRMDKVLTRKTSIFNHTTGELIEKNDEIRLKTKTREEFFLVFVANLKYLTDVPKMSLKILIGILTSYVSWRNEVILNAQSRKELAEYCETSTSVIYKSLDKLVSAGILLKQEGKLFLNPHIFGRGSWNDIQKMRQEITFDYDFEALESKTTMKVTALDKKMPSLENVEVVGYDHYKDDKGVEFNEVIIEEKNQNSEESIVEAEAKESHLLVPQEENKISYSNYEIELLREKNREKELLLKEKELNVKEFELKIKLEELTIQKAQEKSLFNS